MQETIDHQYNTMEETMGHWYIIMEETMHHFKNFDNNLYKDVCLSIDCLLTYCTYFNKNRQEDAFVLAELCY